MKPPLRTEAERIAGTLTKARRRAIRHAWRAGWGEWYVSIETRSDVREALLRSGLLSKRAGMPLRKLGLAVREVLLSQEQTDER